MDEIIIYSNDEIIMLFDQILMDEKSKVMNLLNINDIDHEIGILVV
jgi:hypothetical protein